MKVNLLELGKMVQCIINRAIESGIEEIDIDVDYYWVVASSDLVNFQTENHKINVGSFIDDYENLEKLVKSNREPSVVDFDRIANVIKIVGEEVSYSSKIY